MSQLVQVRQDLLEAGEIPPHKYGYLPQEILEETFIAEQPEEWADEEYNMLIHLPNTEQIFLVSSIDFDFL